MDVTIDEVFMWREEMGRMGLECFGKRGALANSRTYEELNKRCDKVEVVTQHMFFDRFNSFTVNIDDSVPDGILRPAEQ